MTSLLIIGGTGFFGKSILDSFKRGLLIEFKITKILVLARNTEKFRLEYPELVINGVELINGDISSINTLPEADYVIHAATSTHMNDYNYSSKINGKINVEKPVSNYCSLAPTFHLNSKILYCSSGAVYGKQPLNIEKIAENFPFQQNLGELSVEKQNYCLSKRYAEKEFLKLSNLGLNVSIARCFTFSGKYLPKNQHYALGNFIGKAEKGEDLIVNSNGIVYRSYLDADELVYSLMRILEVSSCDCPIYNVGSDKAISINELAKAISLQYSVNYCCPNLNQNLIEDRYVPSVEKLKKLVENKKEHY